MSSHMDLFRRQTVFEILIPNFLQMASVSEKFYALNQSKIYIKQVEHLCSILKDDNISVEIPKYLEMTRSILTRVLAAQNRDSYAVPELPRRESMLEPRIRVRMPSIKPKTIIDDDSDPYTNIEALKLEVRRPRIPAPQSTAYPQESKPKLKSPVVIQPADFSASDSSDDEQQQSNQEVSQRKKSVVMNGKVHNGISKAVQISVEKVQVHTHHNSNYQNRIMADNDNDNDNDLSSILGNISSNRKSNQKLLNGDSDKIMIINNRRSSVNLKGISFDLPNDKNNNKNNKNNKIHLTNGFSHENIDDNETSF